MKKILLVLCALALVGCESATGPVTSPDQALLKSSKKCVSCGYAFYGGDWNWMVIDTITTPPDTIRISDTEAVGEIARSCDVVYGQVRSGGYGGGIVVIDLSHPRTPRIVEYVGTEMQFSGLHISGSNLYAGYTICTGPDYALVCESGNTQWNISDPLNPRLVKITKDK